MERYEHICGGCGSRENVDYLVKAQLEAVRRERDEVKLYLTQERANRESLESCVDRDVQKMKDLHSQLAQRSDERDRLRANLINCSERLAAYYGDNYPAVVDARAALTPAAGGMR